MRKHLLASTIATLFATPGFADEGVERLVIWGNKNLSTEQGPSPATHLSPADLNGANLVTTEDLVKYEPSIAIRRRFIGDANGTLGIRGANMFQTTRSMVFADGVPLHYFLQSRWNGAPRWTLVSASEIASVEVLYGPFSAEYSGNAMGGVVLIETAIPQGPQLHFDSTYFTQDFDAYGYNSHPGGYKSFLSAGNKFGDLSLYVSYNHLQSDSQPQSFYFGGKSQAAAPIPVTGAIEGQDTKGVNQRYFGDTGEVSSQTDNFKLKAGYDFGNWSALLNLAFEDRANLQDDPNTYLRDSQGNPVYSGDVTQDGVTFSVPASRLGVSEQDRQSLSAGLRVKGDLTSNLALEVNLSRFDILKDRTGTSARNPQDPAFTPAGQVADYDDTGWQTAEVKLRIRELGSEDLSLVTGLRHEAYELHYNLYSSADFRAKDRDILTSENGGQTQIDAFFAQLHWQLAPRWSVDIGGRFESFESKKGYFSKQDNGELVREAVPGTTSNKFSPKFSLGYEPAEDWQLRYSWAKAYRFPIVEELFSQYQAFNAISQANPELKPENGTHHNLMLQKDNGGGYLRLNLFQDKVRDVIESQSTTLAGGLSLTTFVPIDEVRTRGVEFIASERDLLTSGLHLNFNLTFTDSTIIENSAAPELEGKRYPRLPRWRANLLADYDLSARWNIGANLQYASNSYGQLDNSDTARHVYGAIDSYLRLGLRTRYAATDQLKLALGVDNLTNDVDYVAHPWPGRTFYLSLSYDL